VQDVVLLDFANGDPLWEGWWSWHNTLTQLYYIVEFEPPTLVCIGSDIGIFNAPLDVPVTVNKRARVLPFSMMLVGADGFALTDADIDPPIITIGVTPGEEPISDDPPLVLESVGKGEDGNLFSFNGMTWGFNLKTKNFTGAGKYTVTVLSGDPLSYVVSPTCVGNFYITR
jgi:hypothetical protein